MLCTEQQYSHKKGECILERHELVSHKLLESRWGYVEVQSFCMKSHELI